ncbi:hypothetical protein I6I07_27940 [Achromobacter deleyi]|uniref:VapC45 PIN like domain-containing protein n=1 Tax=Achromobacter deleyi TaxID=1353891 RepID=A0A7T4B2C6_9BURK|nr:hypothetical protein [Achromobacter deleyi]QQB34382.1 hypothetical protein I6I07_27940 [Achromobacter deleyi]
MNFLFDNNLPPAWAATMAVASIRRFTSTALGKVVQLRERFPANTKDLEWLELLGREKNWSRRMPWRPPHWKYRGVFRVDFGSYRSISAPSIVGFDMSDAAPAHQAGPR